MGVPPPTCCGGCVGAVSAGAGAAVVGGTVAGVVGVTVPAPEDAGWDGPPPLVVTEPVDAEPVDAWCGALPGSALATATDSAPPTTSDPAAR